MANRHERRIVEAALRRLHGPRKCVLLVERINELAQLNIPAELGRRKMRCLVCGRIVQADDVVEVLAQPPNDDGVQA